MEQGKRAALQKLARDARSRAACLRGICTLVRGEAPPVRVVGTTRASADAALRLCCGNTLRLLRIYESRKDDKEYGQVYSHLCLQLQEALCTILSLIGGLPK